MTNTKMNAADWNAAKAMDAYAQWTKMSTLDPRYNELLRDYLRHIGIALRLWRVA